MPGLPGLEVEHSLVCKPHLPRLSLHQAPEAAALCQAGDLQ